MEQKELELLLERYWNCETSVEEEQSLRAYFMTQDIPDDLSDYKNVFVWQEKQLSLSASENLTQRILAQTVQKETKTISFARYFYPLLRVAAAVLVILAMGIGIRTHYLEERQVEQTYSETFSDPNMAMEEARAAFGKISSSLQKGQHALMDSVSVVDSTLLK